MKARVMSSLGRPSRHAELVSHLVKEGLRNRERGDAGARFDHRADVAACRKY